MTRPTYNLPTETNAILCSQHKLENMLDVKSKRCIFEGCITMPTYNLPTETNAVYCSEHKLENMIDVKHKRCIFEGCMTRPNYNLPTETKPIYCSEHRLENMISTSKKTCQQTKCKELSLFGLTNKRAQFCHLHKLPSMINVILENQCSVLSCISEYEHEIKGEKFCNTHIPSEEFGSIVKRLCKYCDMREDLAFVCKRCSKVKNKKEWSIVRHLRHEIHTPFLYNTNKMLQGCSKKRPDIYFDLPRHVVIVEVDEHQHNTYGESCECARLNELVNGIGGRPVIIVRYNPDTVRHCGKILHLPQVERVEILVNLVKSELSREYETFQVKIVQVYYNDNYETGYCPIKEEDITGLVSF